MASARKLPSGSWRVQLFVGLSSEGKRQYKSFTAPTKKEAEYLAARFNLERKQDSSSSVTFFRAAESYIDARSNVLSPSTIASYRRMLRAAFPPLYSLPVNAINQDTIQRFINHYSLSHSPKSTRNVNTFFTAVFSSVLPNIRFHTILPKPIKHEITIPTSEQINRALSLSDPQMRLVILIAATLGLRRGEIAALKWSDISGQSLTVSRSLVLNDKREWVEKSPKSFSGFRTLPLPPFLSSALSSFRPSSNGTYIFSFTPDSITNNWIYLCSKCGFSFRFHDIRHYNASVMLSLNIPDKYAMQRMGHATPAMLKTVYQHLLSEKEKETNDSINAYMSQNFAKE